MVQDILKVGEVLLVIELTAFLMVELLCKVNSSYDFQRQGLKSVCQIMLYLKACCFPIPKISKVFFLKKFLNFFGGFCRTKCSICNVLWWVP